MLKSGIVLSMDPKVGDFEKADVLIEGKKIVAIGPNLKAAATVIDATSRIVMPGLIDTHHHQYQAVLRGIIADALLQEDYNRVINNPGALNAFYQPEDAYAGRPSIFHRYPIPPRTATPALPHSRRLGAGPSSASPPVKAPPPSIRRTSCGCARNISRRMTSC